MVESIVVSDTRTDLRISVLGPLRAWRGEAQLDLGPIRQRALLAALVLRPDATVSQGELLDGVWGLEPPGTGDKVVPVYVYRLRKCLTAAADPAEPLIVRDRGGYRFAGAGAAVDTTLLDSVAAEASAAEQAGELEAAVVTQARALDLFQGEPLSGLPGPYAAGERFRLAERKIALLQEKLEWQLRLGWHTETVGELSALAPVHPHSEPLCALLMRALYGSGRRADALAAFTRLRRRLVDDLGVEPGEELRQVHQAVLREDDLRLGIIRERPQEAAPDRQAVAPQADRPAERRGPEPRAHDELPVGVVALSGRDKELASLTAPGEPRVISVDGVAGAGKTALAVRAAHILRDRYEDGCLYVELHGHSEDGWPPSPQHTLRRLLRTVGAPADLDDPGDLDELAARWRAATAGLRLLLVLDDAAGAEQVRPLLPGGRGSTVLVTSRRRLAGLDVDRRVTIGPIDLEAAEGMLSRIVGEPRATRERGAVRTLARLCGRLPLALRIAAARLQNRPAWTVEYLVGRLADDGERLGELTAEDRSVESAFHNSYERLPFAEQRAFRALGLAPAVELDRLALAAMLGCTARAAERSLENLVDANLLQQPVAGRYRLHEIVAVYARRLSEDEPGDEAAEARDGVLRLFLAAARCASDQGLSGFPTGPSGLSGLDAAGDVPFNGRREAAAWLNASVDRLPDVVAHAAETGRIDYACWIAEALVDHLTRQGRYEECRAAIDAALPHVTGCSDRRMVSSLRIALGITCGLQGRVEQARAWFKDALQISRRAGDLHEQARALGNLGAVECAAGRHLEAAERLTEVLHLAGRLGDAWLTGAAVCDFGVIHHRLGRHEDALDCFARALTAAEEIGSPRLAGRTLYCSGGLHVDLGRQAEAAVLLRQAAELAEQAGDVPLHATVLTRLGMLHEATESLDAALDICVSSGFQRP
ncbi:tetratricopeptide repeat protein [Actinomadura barringtoniae]|uniref:Tetratricopeptide repeat protein n=1 Tax=Actinomadura barringtoniae TaxID=1427535 RepID=A0A939P6X3_9ACTN|nr:BTAD domain-containing putative transcriptional regulator [Actinomadura barringtoniae]MBO2446117.1 tetratricopeptide repeat protein [Actinomadura barringtoniae]